LSGTTKEAAIEDYLERVVKRLGGITRKTVYQGRTAAPDRQCFLPGGRIVILECKRPKKHAEVLQAQEIKVLRDLGFDVHCVNSKEQIDEIFKKYRG
jgi:hypothetical protein